MDPSHSQRVHESARVGMCQRERKCALLQAHMAMRMGAAAFAGVAAAGEKGGGERQDGPQGRRVARSQGGRGQIVSRVAHCRRVARAKAERDELLRLEWQRQRALTLDGRLIRKRDQRAARGAAPEAIRVQVEANDDGHEREEELLVSEVRRPERRNGADRLQADGRLVDLAEQLERLEQALGR